MVLAINAVRLLLLRDTEDQSVQVDYALIPLAFWCTQRARLPWAAQLSIGAVVAASVVCGDLLDIMARRFNWSHGVIIDYAYSMPDLPWPAILPFVGIGFAGAILCTLPFAMHRRPFALWPLGVLVGGLVLGNTLLYGSEEGDVNRARLTRSFLGHAVRGVYNRLVIGRTLLPLTTGSMTTDVLATRPPAQILSVAVESFGLARNPVERTLLIKPLLASLEGRYTVRAGAHAFAGSTLPGEIRELCALRANGIPNTPALRDRLTVHCLPSQLRQRGYLTQALHGNGSLMYDRRVVYPAMGFDRAWFNNDLRLVDPTLRPCPGTAFEGVCDRDLYGRALALFNGRPRFVHVLTLDAHLPLPISAPPSCPPAFANDLALCRYAQVTRLSFAALGHAIMSARHPPDLVIVYGDHAPPFAATRSRAHFASDLVPYIILRRITDRR